MPRLRRLNGQEVVRIFEGFGFAVLRVRGSHHVMRRVANEGKQTLNIPVHGKQPLGMGLLKSIYRDACRHIPEDELFPHFYSE